MLFVRSYYSRLPRFARKDEGWIATLRSQRRDPINTLSTLRDDRCAVPQGERLRAGERFGAGERSWFVLKMIKAPFETALRAPQGERLNYPLTP